MLKHAICFILFVNFMQQSIHVQSTTYKNTQQNHFINAKTNKVLKLTVQVVSQKSVPQVKHARVV